jgi:ferric-dicitrate binding protein FerR (iron transport regulator)
MKEDNYKKAEDILADDSFSEHLMKGEVSEEGIPAEELLLAKNIRNALGTPKTTFNFQQKELLGQSITAQINRSKRNAIIIRFSSAAAVLLIIGLSAFFGLQNQSRIAQFASTLPAKPQSDFTQLMLPGEKIIQIETPESNIEYSSTGEQINIDTLKQIEQTIESGAVAYNTVIVPYGKRTKITLSDNSTIWLNSGSKLVYPVCFDEKKREVFLEGEAVFEVSPDQAHPFHVLSRNLEIKVLGTVFDVSAYDDDSIVNTVLEHGSVELIYKGVSMFGPTKEKMVPGMLAMYDPNSKSLEQKNVNTKDYTSWKDGYLLMEKKSLGSIVKKLSRYYNVSIQIENQDLADETFTGQLDLRKTAMQVLELIAETMDIELQQARHQIKIRKRQASG